VLLCGCVEEDRGQVVLAGMDEPVCEIGDEDAPDLDAVDSDHGRIVA
jgi:hypothetical protein